MNYLMTAQKIGLIEVFFAAARYTRHFWASNNGRSVFRLFFNHSL